MLQRVMRQIDAKYTHEGERFTQTGATWARDEDHARRIDETDLINSSHVIFLFFFVDVILTSALVAPIFLRVSCFHSCVNLALMDK